MPRTRRARILCSSRPCTRSSRLMNTAPWARTSSERSSSSSAKRDLRAWCRASRPSKKSWASTTWRSSRLNKNVRVDVRLRGWADLFYRCVFFADDPDGQWNGAESSHNCQRQTGGAPLIAAQAVGKQQANSGAQRHASSGNENDFGDGQFAFDHVATSLVDIKDGMQLRI